MTQQIITKPAIEPDKARPLFIALIIASCLFLAGIILPMVTLSKFVIVKSDFSIVSGIVELIANGQYILCLVIGAFSIVLPALKIYVLFVLLRSKQMATKKIRHCLHLMHEYGRWAMLDVMVVAVLIMTVKLGAIASIDVEPGFYIFALAVLIIMFITYKVVKLTSDKDLQADS